MNPATYICLESRDALDISAHRSKIHRLQARLTQRHIQIKGPECVDMDQSRVSE
jgi:hypothetical protein